MCASRAAPYPKLFEAANSCRVACPTPNPFFPYAISVSLLPLNYSSFARSNCCQYLAGAGDEGQRPSKLLLVSEGLFRKCRPKETDCAFQRPGRATPSESTDPKRRKMSASFVACLLWRPAILGRPYSFQHILTCLQEIGQTYTNPGISSVVDLQSNTLVIPTLLKGWVSVKPLDRKTDALACFRRPRVRPLEVLRYLRGYSSEAEFHLCLVVSSNYHTRPVEGSVVNAQYGCYC